MDAPFGLLIGFLIGSAIIAFFSKERAREFAVIETMDGGKPIRESRDIDVPLAANHFFYYAGWADKLEYAFPNRHPQSLGVAPTYVS